MFHAVFEKYSYQKLFVFGLKFKFHWMSYILSGNPTRQGIRVIQRRKEYLLGESGKASGRRWCLSRALVGRLDLDVQRWTALGALQGYRGVMVHLDQAPIAPIEMIPKEANR